MKHTLEKDLGQEVTWQVSRNRKNKALRNEELKRMSYLGMSLLIMLLIVCGLLSAVYAKQDQNNRKYETDIQDGNTASQEETGQDSSVIRVLIMTDGYRQEVHSSVEVCAAGGMEICAGETVQETAEGETVQFLPDSTWFQDGIVRINARDGGEVTVMGITRACGHPSYAGVLELRTTPEGIVVINELPVETYLCRVVPSEMPASYELEALKAQAVCARSYAWQQMESYAYPEYEAHVNDSTDYQVYGNSLPQEMTDQAVSETAGQVLCYHGQIVTAYYYSTSCGVTTDVRAWGTPVSEANQYLKSVEVRGENGDYEKDLPWYRWEADIPEEVLSGLIGFYTGKDIGKLKSIEVTRTGAGNIVLQICAVGDKGSVTVDTENKIRRALGGSGYEIIKQDGTKVPGQTLLPSAFFTIEKNEDVYKIRGGGYGHGIGMSQNGANEMAKNGKTYIEILTLFFQGITVEVKM